MDIMKLEQIKKASNPRNPITTTKQHNKQYNINSIKVAHDTD